ncbi:hypothetical protein ANCCAN_23518 [Ancylostoma caninum]|uniref:Uncharacterized protein n=1 Tax=Ancylostoma caninum TaxID=29170 RepID=A0A368FEZ7_ANCCA|nr:hypothetical protein ANCCAN_23518 [Ancylostoma caninum]
MLSPSIPFIAATIHHMVEEFDWHNASGLTTLNPLKKVNLTRIVAVSLRGIDLSSIVVPPKGVAVKASVDFTEEDISVIVDAVVKGF